MKSTLFIRAPMIAACPSFLASSGFTVQIIKFRFNVVSTVMEKDIGTLTTQALLKYGYFEVRLHTLKVIQ